MDLLQVFVILAMLAVVGTLILGISAMTTGGEVGHRSSVEWMTWRVGLQAGVVLIILLALVALR